MAELKYRLWVPNKSSPFGVDIVTAYSEELPRVGEKLILDNREYVVSERIVPLFNYLDHNFLPKIRLRSAS